MPKGDNLDLERCPAAEERCDGFGHGDDDSLRDYRPYRGRRQHSMLSDPQGNDIAITRVVSR